MPQSMIMLLILGIIDVVARIILFFITPLWIVKAIGIIILIKGLWTLSKHFFRF